MRNDKQTALNMRLQGKSYNEINSLLSIPKSTLSNWFTGLVLSSKASSRIQKRVHAGSLRGLIKRNKQQTHLARERVRAIRNKSKKEIKNLTLSELKLIGLTLYWAEGYKRLQLRDGKEITQHPVALSNSDPLLIRIFLQFLRKICYVKNDSIRAEIRIYEHMSEQYLLKFWQKITRLPRKNFSKVYNGVSKSSLHKRPFNRLPYGTICIRVNSTSLFHQIMGWLEGLTNAGVDLK